MVEIQQYGQQQQATIQPTSNPEDVFGFVNGGGGAKSISFNTKDQFGQNQSLPLGTAFTGILRANPTLQQALDFDTKQPKTYQDGNPVKQVRMELGDVMVSVAGQQWQPVQQVIPADDAEEDDGVRALFVSNQMKRALQDATAKAGVKTFGVGTRVTVRLVNMVPAKKAGYNPQKVYEIELSEVQPFVSAAEQEVQQQLGTPTNAQLLQAAQQPQWAQAAPADPSQGVPPQAPSYVPQVQQQQATIAAERGLPAPQQPQYGQVLQQGFQAGQQAVAPQQPIAPPVQQLPHTQVQVPQQAAPAAPPADLSNAVAQVRAVMQAGVDRAGAIAGVAGQLGIDPTVLDATESNTPF